MAHVCKELIYIIDSELELDVLNINYPNVKNYYNVFTLEEFLEKFPYKVGDKVLYKHDNKTYFIRKMFWENGKILYELSDEVYENGCSMPDTLIFDVDTIKLQPYKEETMEEKNNDNWAKWDLPEGYEFQDKDGNIINTSVIRLVKKQLQYPKTYEECCKILDWNHRDYDRVGYNSELLCKLQVLLLCRDAYWKIASEQMGLSEPWILPFNENQDSKPMYFIVNKLGKIYKDNANIIINNRILAFPTKEMRDAFFENFKDLIEYCKELL